MPWATVENAGFIEPRAVGPVLLATPVLGTQPQSIAAGGQWSSGVLQGDGYKAIAVGVTSTQPGQVAVQRYLDLAGAVALGAPTTAPITAGQPAVATVTDGKPYATFSISISNTGTAAATISNFAALLAAN